MLNLLRKHWVLGVALFALLLVGQPSADAIVSATPVFPQAVGLGLAQFTSSDTPNSTTKTVYTAGANGSKCTAIIGSTTDASAAHQVTLDINRSATAYVVVAVTVAANSGSANGTPPVSFMSPGVWPGLSTDSDGNPFFYMKSGDIIEAQYATAITAAKLLNIIATCSDL